MMSNINTIQKQKSLKVVKKNIKSLDAANLARISNSSLLA